MSELKPKCPLCQSEMTPLWGDTTIRCPNIKCELYSCAMEAQAVEALNRRAPSAEQYEDAEPKELYLGSHVPVEQLKSIMLAGLVGAEQQQQEPVAIAIVADEDYSDYGGRVRWLLNPMPPGSYLYEAHQQHQVQPQLVIGQEVVEQRDEYVGYLQMIADKIGLDAEPHQTYFDRLMERIDFLKQPQAQGEPIAAVILETSGTRQLVFIEDFPKSYLDRMLEVRYLFDHEQPRAAVPDVKLYRDMLLWLYDQQMKALVKPIMEFDEWLWKIGNEMTAAPAQPREEKPQ